MNIIKTPPEHLLVGETPSIPYVSVSVCVEAKRIRQNHHAIKQTPSPYSDTDCACLSRLSLHLVICYCRPCLLQINLFIAGVVPKAPGPHGQCAVPGRGPLDPCSEGDAWSDFDNTGSAHSERTAEYSDQGTSSLPAERRASTDGLEIASQIHPYGGFRQRFRFGWEG
jgi:hypothetical protein